ncbi:MAG TPA: ATP-binding cassette domain-containing protein, partial [Nocardioides sp.]|uniref:ATP-binding cassette domain-containing protein n=1 Tax=Nocardioides sp. TaxID=35761 RepID=UPI002B512F60
MTVQTPDPLAPVVVRDLSVAYPDRTVLDAVDLTAQPGRRIGLVGENGAGKSTLLRAVARRLPAPARVTGTVQAPADLVLLDQEPPFSDSSTLEEVLGHTLGPLRRAVAEVERLATGLDDPAGAAAFARALEWAQSHDAWDADRRAAEAAQRLGLGDLDRARRIGSLSGGQRTRLALAAVMTTRPTALLLDEPSNHLDDDALEVLADFLTQLPGVVLLASHDRVLLDQVCTDLVDLDPSGPGGRSTRRFHGGWSAYQEHRDAARRRWEEEYAAQQERLAGLRAATRSGTSAIAHDRQPRDNDKFIYSFKGAGVDRTLARRKRNAQVRLAVEERDRVPRPPAPLRLSTPLTGARRTGRVVQLRDLLVRGRVALDRLDVEAGERLLVTGANGSGKSTLLGVLSGRVRADGGTVRVVADRVVELEQDTRFPDPGRSAESTYRRAVGDATAESAPLRRLGLLHPRDLRTPVSRLSVGQRRRLALA